MMAMDAPVGRVVHIRREFSAGPPATLGLPTRLTVSSFGDAAKERDVERRWAELRDTARLGYGTVDHRRVRTAENGSVTAFVLEIVGDGTPFSAQWHASGRADDALLQPQVPGVGSPVQIWRTTPDGPLLADSLDPTVVRP